MNDRKHLVSAQVDKLMAAAKGRRYEAYEPLDALRLSFR
jgi:hypothetical protein